MKNHVFLVNAAILRAAKLFTDTNAIDSFHGGIRITKEGKIVATNGHVLFCCKNVMPADTEELNSFHHSPDEAITFYPEVLPSMPDMFLISVREDAVLISGYDLDNGLLRPVSDQGKGFVIDCNYPYWKAAFPSYGDEAPKPTEKMYFNPSYLELIGAADRKLNPSKCTKNPTAKILFFGEMAGIEVKIPIKQSAKHAEATLVIMPLNKDKNDEDKDRGNQ